MNVIGKPQLEPTIAQVQTESEILEKILKPDLHENLMEYAYRIGVSPFWALNNLVFRALLNNMADAIKARSAQKGEDN